MSNNITLENYISVAMHNYDNVQCNTIEEFEHDLNRIMCIKKIVDKYLSSGKINIQLVLNHAIVLYNSFDELSIELLQLRLDDIHMPVVKSLLVYLGYIESNDMNEFQEDVNILNMLRKI